MDTRVAHTPPPSLGHEATNGHMSTIARGSFNHVKERLLRAPKRERTSHVARPKSRDERLARVAQLERRESTKRYARYAAFSVAAIVLLAGAAYGISRIPKGPTTVHWHANWKVYVDGEPVRFTDRQFDMSMAKSRIHFHLPDDAKLHLEGPDNRLTLLDLFHSPLKGDISDTKLILPTGSTRPGSFENDANMRLQAYYKPLKLSRTLPVRFPKPGGQSSLRFMASRRISWMRWPLQCV